MLTGGRGLLLLLVMALPAVASGAPRLELRCDFCGATPTRSATLLDEPLSPSYPAPPRVDPARPEIVETPLAPNPRIAMLEQRLRELDGAIRALDQSVPAGPLVLGLGAGAALFVGAPLLSIGVVLFAAVPNLFTTAVVLTTLGGVLTGKSILLGVLAYRAMAERKEDARRLAHERRQVAEELERLRAGPPSARDATRIPMPISLRF